MHPQQNTPYFQLSPRNEKKSLTNAQSDFDSFTLCCTIGILNFRHALSKSPGYQWKSEIVRDVTLSLFKILVRIRWIFNRRQSHHPPTEDEDSEGRLLGGANDL
jgi:hypothetical protein